MLKQLLVVAILLLASGAINVFIYDQTFSTNSPQQADSVCTGEDIATDTAPSQSRVQVGVSGGEPLNTGSTISLLEQPCTGNYTPPTFRLADFMRSWQFYVNWLIWSLPLLGIAYVINGRYAHSRH